MGIGKKSEGLESLEKIIFAGRSEVAVGIRPSNLRGRVTTSIGRSGSIGVMITFDGVPETVVIFDEEVRYGRLVVSGVETGFMVVPLITIRLPETVVK